jgi:hypothetical protein
MQQHGHRTASLQTAPFFKAFPRKKIVRHCEFSEKFGILEKHDATENAWFLSNLICLPGNGP